MVYLLAIDGIQAASALGRYELLLLGPRRVRVSRRHGSTSVSDALPGAELPGSAVTLGLGAPSGQNLLQLFPALPLCSVSFSAGGPCGSRGLFLQSQSRLQRQVLLRGWWVGDCAGHLALRQPALAPLCPGDQLPSGAWLWTRPTSAVRQTLPFSRFHCAQPVSGAVITNPWPA